jgi:hypothetical protein
MGLTIILFSVVGLLTGLVLLVVGIAGSKKQLTLTGTILAVVGVFGLIFGVYYSVSSAFSGVRDVFANAMEQADSLNRQQEKEMELPESGWTDGGSQDAVGYLKSLVPDSVRPFVKKRFFKKANGFEMQRFPLVFPYAIHRTYVNDNATFVNERALVDTRAGGGIVENLVLNVTHLAFDEKMILLKTADYDINTNTQNKNIKYFLVEFGKDGLFEFKTENELIKAATGTGYTGSYDFLTVYEYGERFTGM